MQNGANIGSSSCVVDEEKKSAKSTISISSLAEPAQLLAFVSVTFYIFSYRYYEGFCQRLSLPFGSLEIPFTFYLAIGFKIVVFILSFLYLIAFLLFMDKIKVVWKFLLITFIVIISFISYSIEFNHLIYLDTILEYGIDNVVFLFFILLISTTVIVKNKLKIKINIVDLIDNHIVCIEKFDIISQSSGLGKIKKL